MEREGNLNQTNEIVSDKAGIYLSALCCIHCLATPLLVIFAPTLGGYFESEIVHIAALLLVVPLGLYAFISKLKIHKNKLPLYVGLLGMAFLALSLILHEVGHEGTGHHGHELEYFSSIIGGCALIWAHLKNIKLCQCKRCEH